LNSHPLSYVDISLKKEKKKEELFKDIFFV